MSSQSSLDIRMPMGTMFSLLGFVLTGYGVISYGSDAYKQSLGINVNLWWGLVILVFGLTMLALSWRATRGTPPTHTATPPAEPTIMPVKPAL